MKKTAASIILVLVLIFILLVGCTDKDEFKTNLQKIIVPDMSVSILEADEETQLSWLKDISRFQDETLRSKTSNLSDKDIQTVKDHLSQVYGPELVQIHVEDIYKYDEGTRTYYVPDGDWSMYSLDEWSSSEISLTSRSEQSATFLLSGIDFAGDEQKYQLDFSISNGKLLLEKRTYLR
jgi:hypothetical protein